MGGFIIHIAITSLCIIAALGKCPYELCSCSGDSISCFGPGYKTLPVINDTGDEYTYFTIYSNTLEAIPDHSLPDNLQVLTFKNTPILNISSHAFDQSANTLRQLFFAGANFAKIPDAFSALKALKFFQLTYAPISDWNTNALQQMGSSVKSLQLSYVGLTSWPAWMKYFTSLQKLSIANDPVAPLPDEAFDAFKNSVTDITFGSVNLTQISKAFSTLTEIETLFLINASITELTNLPQSTTLRSLSLSQNNIADSDHLIQSLLPYSKTLNFLDVSINQLSDFPDLSSLSALSILDFQSNELSDPKTNSLPSSVTMLYLGRNQLTKIPPSVSSMKKLKLLLIAYNNITVVKDTEIPAALPELDISYNQIYGLEDDCFPENSSLTRLDLSSNPIFGISDRAFRNLGGLQDLGLQDTRLTRLPMALSSLTSLQSLSMDYNGRLECTCQEAGLLKWYKSLPNLRITGDCVNMTITHFFEDVAPKCHL